jgi:GTP cyclohydrolase I
MTQEEQQIQEILRQQLRFIGENTEREGLIDTPARVIKSWKEIYGGYRIDPKSLLTIFTEVDGYQEMVVLKDIELFSTCEHHCLPFFGKAHVAYLPDKRVIGISKLARLVDVFARRLQIQERLGEQVTKALMEHLQPKGAACTIQASHMCMRMRGCNKQNSEMITTSLKGVFETDPTVRQEYLTYIK